MIVRGASLNKPSKTTQLFALMYQRKLKEAGCLDEHNNLVMDKYREAFERDDLDLQLLCSAMGTQQMDESFLHMQTVTDTHLQQ